IQTPSVSPTHHVLQVIAASRAGRMPATRSVKSPQVALTRQLAGPPKAMKEKISSQRIKAEGHLTKRRTSHAPNIACAAAPSPMLPAVASDLKIAGLLAASRHRPAFTTNDPSQTA